MFKVIAPKGKRVAYREIVAPCGKSVLGVNTGEGVQRLGNLRESVVATKDEKGIFSNDIYCNHGGVIRALLMYLNYGKFDKPYRGNDFSEILTVLDDIRKKAGML